MKETLKDKTIDVGNCSECGSTDLMTHDDVDGEDVFKFYTCNDCNYEGVEWIVLFKQYYSDIRDEFNKLSQ